MTNCVYSAVIVVLPEQRTKKSVLVKFLRQKKFLEQSLKKMDGRNHRALAPIASHGSAELLSDNTYFMEAEEGDEVSDAFTTTTTTT